MERIEKSKLISRIVLGLAILGVTFLVGCKSSQNPTVTPAPSVSDSATERGAAVVSEYLARDAAPYRKERIRFTVKSDDGKTDVYEVNTSRRQQGDTTTTLSVIVKPDDDAGTGSLAIQQKGQPTTNVTYSRTRDDYRETDTGKTFFGGLTAQELLGEWDKYDFRVLRESNDGVDLEGKLRTGEHSMIAVMKVTFDPATKLPIAMTLIDSGGKEIRTYSGAKISNVDGHAYISHIEVDNPVYKSHITIDVLGREYPAKLDDALFTREALKNASKR